MLDDPLSAVDAQVGKNLLENVIGRNGYLANSKATRILVTHQVHLLQEADHILILDQGRAVQQGSYIELGNNIANQFTKQLLEDQKITNAESVLNKSCQSVNTKRVSVLSQIHEVRVRILNA